MFSLLNLCNSIPFLEINVSVGFYILQKFFRSMTFHGELAAEVEKFSSLTDRSRDNLDYVGARITEAMKEMESDIEREIYVTHNLTNLCSKIAFVSRRFKELEEEIIELARLSHNVENVMVATPTNINEEVRRILGAMRHAKQSPSGEQKEWLHRPRSSRKSSKRSRSHGTAEAAGQQQQQQQQQQQILTPGRRRSPDLQPEVMLLVEQRSDVPGKAIGFRPPWMCPI